MYGGLTTYALEVLVLFIINTIPQSRSSPINVLKHLIQYFGNFDWENQVVTYCRVVSVSEYVSVITHKTDLYRGVSNLILSPINLAEIKNKVRASNENKLMPLK